MPEYHVTWEIDVEADNLVDAARVAHACQQDPTEAVVFDVHEHGHEDVVLVNLDEFPIWP